MKELISSLFIVTLLAGPAMAKDMKLGYVDMPRALNEVQDGKNAKAKLKKDFEGKQIELDRLQNELKEKRDAFEKQQGMMKADVKQRKAEELQRSFMDLQQTYAKLQKELMAKESALTQGIYQKLSLVIDSIGDRDGYTLIMDIGDTVLYHKSHMDLTDEIIKEYNRRHGK